MKLLGITIKPLFRCIHFAIEKQATKL